MHRTSCMRVCTCPKSISSKQACLLCTCEDANNDEVFDVYMALENQTLYKIDHDKKTEAVPALFSTFFVFHMNYPPGTSHVFVFWVSFFTSVNILHAGIVYIHRVWSLYSSVLYRCRYRYIY